MLRSPETAAGDLLDASLGTLWYYSGTADPINGLICDGRIIKYSDYPELTEMLNTIHQTGNPRKDIAIPDCRGLFLRGFGGSSGSLLKVQTDAITNKLRGWFRISLQHGTADQGKFGGCFKEKSVIWRGDGGQVGARETIDYEFDPSLVCETSSETRPRNMAFNIVIGTGRLGKKKKN